VQWRCFEGLGQTRRVCLIGSTGACFLRSGLDHIGPQCRAACIGYTRCRLLEGTCYGPLSDDTVSGIWRDLGKTCATHDLDRQCPVVERQLNECTSLMVEQGYAQTFRKDSKGHDMFNREWLAPLNVFIQVTVVMPRPYEFYTQP